MLSRRLDEKHHADLLNTLDTEGRARLRSCAGPLAAGWQLASPAQPAERLEDRDYAATARALLGQELAATDRRACCNRHSTGDRVGEPCREALCGRAHHAYRCVVGGGLKRRSVAVERVLERTLEDCGYQAAREAYVPQWDRFPLALQRGSLRAPWCLPHTT